MGERVIESSEALQYRAGYCAGEADATDGTDQVHVYLWIDVVVDHRGVAERIWAARRHLVAWDTATRSRRTAKRFTQAPCI